MGHRLLIATGQHPLIQDDDEPVGGADGDQSGPVAFAATTTDNCDPRPTVDYSISPGSGFPAGATVVTCTAKDACGNESSCSFEVRQAALEFACFLPPLDGADTTGGSSDSPLRTFKLNSTIPVKFAASCSGSPVLFGVHPLQAVKYAGQKPVGDPINATPGDQASMGEQFRLADGQWHFNLDTRATGMGVGVWQLCSTLSDGRQHSVWIQIK